MTLLLARPTGPHVPALPNTTDNDVSDVASSINAPSLTPSVASSPRLNPPATGNGPTSASRGNVPLPPLPLPLGVALNPLLRRKDAKDWTDEGLESPT